MMEDHAPNDSDDSREILPPNIVPSLEFKDSSSLLDASGLLSNSSRKQVQRNLDIVSENDTTRRRKKRKLQDIINKNRIAVHWVAG